MKITGDSLYNSSMDHNYRIFDLIKIENSIKHQSLSNSIRGQPCVSICENRQSIHIKSKSNKSTIHPFELSLLTHEKRRENKYLTFPRVYIQSKSKHVLFYFNLLYFSPSRMNYVCKLQLNRENKAHLPFACH